MDFQRIMKTKYFILLFLFLAFHTRAQDEVSTTSKKPNVLMIVVDDMNDYPMTPRFNEVQTPNLDAFAESAVNFSKAYCAGPICNPSRASVISGIAPYKSGIYDNSDAWETSPLVNISKPLPQAFKENGYTTMWSGKFWHGIKTPSPKKLKVWWDEYNSHETFGPYSPDKQKSESFSREGNINYGSLDIPDDEWQDTRVANQTIERLQREYTQPFFMVCGLVRPHSPFTAPQRFYDLYDVDQLATPPWKEDDRSDIPNEIWNITKNKIYMDKLISSGQWPFLIQSYLASISFADWNIGRILNALEKSNYAENTIVMIWSDHGFHLGEKSHFGKWALWERTTHTLFMIKPVKKLAQAQIIDKTVSLLDIYPTLKELCSLKGIPENQLDGISLVPLLKNPELSWNKPVITTYLQGNHAVRNDRYRYIQYAGGGEELYDLKQDPNEFNNLAGNGEYHNIKEDLKTHIPEVNANPSGPRRRK